MAMRQPMAMRWLLCFLITMFAAGSSITDERYAAVPLTLSGLMPRYMPQDLFAQAKRDALCEQDYHSCRDVGFEKICCRNSQYCFINGTGQPECCAIGMNCILDSNCDSNQYQCVKPVTSRGTVKSSVTGCCDRRCPDPSSYRCPDNLGGKCCHYSQHCALDGCVATKTTSARALESGPRVTNGAGSACPEAAQQTCADGTGCCQGAQRCTKVSDSAYCAAGLSTLGPGSGDEVDEASDSHLSAGAKAGIGVGAGLGGLAILGAAAWICFVKRARPGARGRGPRIVENGTGVVSETTVSPRPRHAHGLTEDYIGPRAISGPYTETVPASHASDVSPGPERAVPSQPDGPGDIAPPVEMDALVASTRAQDRLSPPIPWSSPRPMPGAMQNRFELPGGDMNARQPSPSLPLRATPTSHITSKSEC